MYFATTTRCFNTDMSVDSSVIREKNGLHFKLSSFSLSMTDERHCKNSATILLMV